jgi:hypothetical protein
MIPLEVLEAMQAKGLSLADAIEIAQAWETAKPSRTKNAERQAKWRRRHSEQKVNNVTDNVTDNVTRNATDNVSEPLPLSPSLPTPLSSTNPNQLPPIVPQTGSKVRPSAKQTTDPIADLLWSAASQVSRDRSGRQKVRKAVAAAIGDGASPEALTASVKALCRSKGEFANGLHLIIEGEHWRDYGPKPPPSQTVADPETEARRLKHLKDTGEWREAWGERPKAA